MFHGEHDEKHRGMEDCCMGIWHKEFKKEFKLALLNKKEKMLEAKLEFIREMKKLVEQMEDKK